MHRRTALTLGTAAGGLAAAFLSVAIAFAEVTPDSPSPDGPDAFTFNGLTYDPFTVTFDADGNQVVTEGWYPATSSFGAAPWFEFGQLGPAKAVRELLGPEALALRAGGQTFEVYDATGEDLGIASGSVNTTNILGIFQSTQVTIEDFASTVPQKLLEAGTDAPLAPPVGSVYDVTEFLGITNIYWAIPGADGGTNINDVLDLFGWKIPILINFDATDPFDVGAGFAGIDVGSDVGGGADPLAFLGL